jgi:hypothetical protein
MELVGYEMTRVCTNKVFGEAGHKEGEGRDLVGVIELHDCFAANEVRKIVRLTTNSGSISVSSSHTLHWAFAFPGKLTP